MRLIMIRRPTIKIPELPERIMIRIPEIPALTLKIKIPGMTKKKRR